MRLPINAGLFWESQKLPAFVIKVPPIKEDYNN